MREDGAGTGGAARRRTPDRRWFAVPTLVTAVVMWTWLQSRFTGSLDATLLLVEGTGVVVGILAGLWVPGARSRRALRLLTAFVALTTLGDAYWLLVVDPTGLSYLGGDVEPGVTVTLYVLRYLVLALLLVHAAPPLREPTRRWAPAAFGGRGVLSPAQALACTTALLLVTTPLGGVVDDGKSYSLFCFCDVVLAAAALALWLQAAGRVRRPQAREMRLLTGTVVGVIALALADAAVVLSMTGASVAVGRVGFTFSVGGFLVLVFTALRTPEAGPAGGCLPPPPRRTHPHLVVAALVAVRVAAPAVLLAVSTAQLVAGAAGSPGAVGAAAVRAAFTGAAPTGSGLGPATLGTVVVAVALSLLQAGRQVVHAQRDGRRAAAAERDELTGAYSRRGLTAHVRRHLPASPRAGSGAGWTLALLDLDGFKAVNDTFGHDAGDEVLRAVVRRCARVVAGCGVVARFGGDEFVVLLGTGGPGTAETRAVLRRLEDEVSAPLELTGGVTVAVGTSVGAAGIDPDGWDGDLSAVLKRADLAMYDCKRRRAAGAVDGGRVPPPVPPPVPSVPSPGGPLVGRSPWRGPPVA
ncbi:diguanylate cyclase (GGDEF)-like protein [Kineococcus radiotolerans]|uniref:Diguanylate cyclase (GGDEF)-like protein n=1 Tax=Kineococcus radiotolerans TaxID=131568 RepID=A0A7W4TPG1_KINRA|nr:GGDEF domain-containing protein [Kineococcus radiotolerans]MBB2902647.1 diguanylate cyclase (GGDEF)-like protein [Kineococcus radiotolerans]